MFHLEDPMTWRIWEKELELELKRNDEQAREFEAEILQEKLLLKDHINISDKEVTKIKNRLHQLGYKILS